MNEEVKQPSLSVSYVQCPCCRRYIREDKAPSLIMTEKVLKDVVEAAGHELVAVKTSIIVPDALPSGYLKGFESSVISGLLDAVRPYVETEISVEKGEIEAKVILLIKGGSNGRK